MPATVVRRANAPPRLDATNAVAPVAISAYTPKSSRQIAASAHNTPAAIQPRRSLARAATSTAPSENSRAGANGFAPVGCAIAHAVGNQATNATLNGASWRTIANP